MMKNSRAHLSPAGDEAKCAGIGCESKDRCSRFVRPAADIQAWASYYSLLPECGGFVPADQEKITLVLPYPISANRYWRAVIINKHAMMVPTKEAKAYKSEVGRLAKAAGLAIPHTSRVLMEIKLYPNRPQDWMRRMKKDPITWDDTVQCIDLGNAEKVLSDALQGIIYDDDKRIWKQTKERMSPDEHGARVVVTITPILNKSPQAGLL